MDSWADYLQTLQSNDQDFQRRNISSDAADSLYESAFTEPIRSSMLSNSVNEEMDVDPVPTLATDSLDQALNLAEHDLGGTLEHAESELHRRLSNLKESSMMEEALLSSLHADAKSTGLDLTSRLRRETLYEAVGAETTFEETQAPMDSPFSETPRGSGIVALGDFGPDDGHPSEQYPAVAGSSNLIGEELQLQKAEEKHLIAEHERLVKRQREEAGEKAALQFRLDSLQARKTGCLRIIRQYKQQTRELYEKMKRGMTWLTIDGKTAYEKEKEKNAALMARVLQILATHEALQKAIELSNLKKASHCQTVAQQTETIRQDCNPFWEKFEVLNNEIGLLREGVNLQEKRLDEKKSLRDFRILQELEEEEAQRRRELQLLLASLRRQKGAGEVSSADLGELVTLELKGSGLSKIPDLAMVPKVRRVILDDNFLSNLRGLEFLKELRFLTIQNNRCGNLDLSWFVKLQILNASRNMLTDIRVGEGEAKSDLRLLVYVDLSDNRMHDPHLGLSGSSILQYLNVSGNAFMELPEFPNDMLYEFDAHHNNIRNMSIGRWAPSLRIFDASFNNIRTCDPVSMAMCPFLQEIRLSNNLITDFTSVFSLAVCRNLEVLQLEANPILSNREIYNAIAVLFPRLKVLNGISVDVIAHEMGRKRFSYCTPTQTVKWCRQAVEHLQIFIENEHHRNASMQKLDAWRDICQSQERILAASMGPRYSPFLQYLYASGPQTGSPTADSEIQEERIDWLTALLQQNLVQAERLKKSNEPHADMALSHAVDQLTYQIQESSASIIQAMWRGRRSRRSNLRRKGAARTLQRWWRRHMGRSDPEKVRVIQESAAFQIQAAWKGYAARVKFKRQRGKIHLIPTPSESQNPPRISTSREIPSSSFNKVVLQTAEELDSDSEIDQWLGDLDDKRDYFCGEETLVPLRHERKPSEVPEQRKQLPVPWPDGDDPEAERFLQQQYHALQNDLQGPAIQPRNPIRNLLLSRGVVKAPTPGTAVFGKHLYDDVEVPTGRLSGFTADMLMSRRWGSAQVSEEVTAPVVTESVIPAETRVSKAYSDTNILDQKSDQRSAETLDQKMHKKSDQKSDRKSDQGLDENDEDSGWRLTSKLTQALLDRKLDRDARLHRQAELRERLKDPMERLRAHKDPREAKGTPIGGTMDVTYAWDLQRLQEGQADVSRRASARLPPLSYSHEVSQAHLPTSRHATTDRGPTLLINNYLTKKLVHGQHRPGQPDPPVIYSTLTFPHPKNDLGSGFGHHTLPAYGAPLGHHSHRQIHYAFDHSDHLPTL
ncbi:hypothetical protein DFJ77DRAFT_469795 [Powellomyces hirtus]|nr:hypothetical protein DFJ77DRAFT_469795 [Powellomyces hirtus]